MKRTRLIFAAALLGLLCSCSQNCSGSAEAKNAGSSREARFTFVNWNVQTFFDGKKDGVEYDDFKKTGNWNTENYKVRLQRLCQFITQVNADIYVFEEIENEAVIHDISNQLCADGHNWNQKKFWNYSVFAKDETAAIGIGVLSRYPLLNLKTHTMDIRLHKQSQPSTRYILEISTSIQGQQLTIFANHWKSKSGGQEKSEIWRDWQESILAKRISSLRAEQGESELPILICGDFNRDASDFICDNQNILFRFADFGGTDFISAASLWFTEDGRFSTKNGSYFYDDSWERIDNILLCGRIKAAEFLPLAQVPWANAAGYPVSYKMYSGEGWSDHLPLYASLILFNQK